MKKSLKFLFTLCLCFFMPFMLTSCDDHVFLEKWTYDEEYHWHQCVELDCSETQGKAAHDWVVDSEEGDTVNYKCSVCSATKSHTHKRDYNWSKDETHHWKACTEGNCQEKLDKTEHTWNSGVKEGFDTTLTCTVCGQTKVETEQHTHTPGSTWEHNKTSHWKVCTDSRCANERIELANHTWGEPVINGNEQTLTCTVCGESKTESYTEGHTHIYSNWLINDTHHWKECINGECDENKVELGEHTWSEGVTKGDTITYKCLDCGKTKSHTHTYSDWLTDGTHHWKKCTDTNCQFTTPKLTHSWNNGEVDGDKVTYTCTICQKTKSHTHSFATTWNRDDTHHWKECTDANCSHSTEKVAHTWNDGVANGNGVTYTCTVCSKTKTHTHTYSDAWSNNDTHHWKECTDSNCDGKTLESTHSWGNGVLNGTEYVYTCTTCGKTKTSEHTHTPASKWENDAEYHWKECTDSNCNEQVEKAAHTWGNGVLNGTEYVYTCTTCGKTKTSEHTHTPASKWENDAEYHWKECTDSNCNEQVEKSTHTWGNGVLNGTEYVYTCTVCGKTKTSSHSHTPASKWENDAEYHWKECTDSNCNEKLEKAEHNWNNGVLNGDIYTYTCTTCGKTKTSEHTHTPVSKWEKDAEYHWKECTDSNCDEKLEKAEHNWNNGVINGEVITYTCTVCMMEKTLGHIHTYYDWTSNETHHWQDCTDPRCSYSTEKMEHIWNNGEVNEDEITYTCVICNKTKVEEYKEKTLIYLNALEQFSNQKYVFRISDLILNIDKYTEVDFVEICLEVSSDGSLEGYAVFSLTSEDIVLSEVYAIISEGKMYGYSCNRLGDIYEDYVVYNFDYILGSLISSIEGSIGLTIGEVVTMISLYEDEIKNFLSFINETYSINRESIDAFLGGIVNTFYNVEVSENEITYTLTLDSIKNFNAYLDSTTIEDMVNSLFGENAYNSIREFLVELVDMTVEEFIALLEENGIILEEVLSDLDELSVYVSGLLYRYVEFVYNEYLPDAFEPVYGSSSQDVTTGATGDVSNIAQSTKKQFEMMMQELEAIETFEDFLTMVMGSELPFEDLGEFIKSEEFSKLTFIELFNMMSGSEVTSQEYKLAINGILLTYGENTIYEIINIISEKNYPEDYEFEPIDIKENIDMIIDMLSEMISITYKTDKNGIILNSTINANFADAISGKVELIKDYESTVDIEAKKKEIKNYVSSYTSIKLSMFPEKMEGFSTSKVVEGGNTILKYFYESGNKNAQDRWNYNSYTFVFDSNGDLISINYAYYTEDRDSNLELTYNYTIEDNLNFTPNSYSIIVSPLCDKNYLEIWLYSADSSYYYENGYYGDSYSRESYNNSSICLYFDKINQKFLIAEAIYNEGNDSLEHSFVEIRNDKIKTSYGYLLHYICTKCGKSSYEIAYTVCDYNQYSLTNNIQYIINYNPNPSEITDYYYVYQSIIYGYDTVYGLWKITDNVSLDDLEKYNEYDRDLHVYILKSTAHKYNTYYTFDNEYHWIECSRDDCDEIINKAKHNWGEGYISGDYVYYYCLDNCGAYKSEPHTHIFQTYYDYNNLYHWKECTSLDCNYKTEKVEHTLDSGVEVGDSIVYTCIMCDYTKTHTHTYVDGLKSNRNYHWKECLECGQACAKEEHTLDSGLEFDTYISYTCTICSRTKSEIIPGSNLLYLNALEQLSNQKYAIKVTNFVISIEETSAKVNFAELYLNISEGGKITGYGTCMISDPNLSVILTDVEVVFDGDKIYCLIENYEEDIFEEYVVYTMNDILGSLKAGIESSMGCTLEEAATMISLYEDEILELAYMLSELYIQNRVNIDKVLGEIINTFYNVEVSENEITYTLTLDSIKKLNAYLDSTTIEEMIDSFFGEDSYDSIRKFLVDLVDMTVEEFIVMLEENGYELEEILADLDTLAVYYAKIMYKYVEFVYYGYFLDELQPVYGASSVENDNVIQDVVNVETSIKRKLEIMMQSLKLVTSFEELLIAMDNELPFTDLEEFIKSEEISKLTFTEIFNMITESNTTSKDYKLAINGTFTTYGEFTIYDIINMILESNYNDAIEGVENADPYTPVDIKANVDMFVDMLSQMFNISYKTDKNGIVLSSTIELNIPDLISGKVEFIKDYKTIINYDSIKQEIVSQVEKIKFTEAMLPESVKDYTRTVTKENGNTIVTYYTEDGERYAYGSWDYEEYKFTFDANSNLIAYDNIDIHESRYYDNDNDGILDVDYSWIDTRNFVFEPGNYSYITFKNCNKNIIGLCLASANSTYTYKYIYSDGSTNEYSHSQPAIYFYYDLSTNKLILDSSYLTNMDHEYIEIKNDKVETPYGYIIHLLCSGCGGSCYKKIYTDLSNYEQREFNDYITYSVNEGTSSDYYFGNYSVIYSYNTDTNLWEVDKSVSINNLEVYADYFYCDGEIYTVYKLKTA